MSTFGFRSEVSFLLPDSCIAATSSCVLCMFTLVPGIAVSHHLSSFVIFIICLGWPHQLLCNLRARDLVLVKYPHSYVQDPGTLCAERYPELCLHSTLHLSQYILKIFCFSPITQYKNCCGVSLSCCLVHMSSWNNSMLLRPPRWEISRPNHSQNTSHYFSIT